MQHAPAASTLTRWLVDLAPGVNMATATLSKSICNESRSLHYHSCTCCTDWLHSRSLYGRVANTFDVEQITFASVQIQKP